MRTSFEKSLCVLTKKPFDLGTGNFTQTLLLAHGVAKLFWVTSVEGQGRMNISFPSSESESNFLAKSGLWVFVTFSDSSSLLIDCKMF